MIAALCPDVYFPPSVDTDPQAVPDDVRPGVPDGGWTRDELDRRADWEVGKTQRKRSCAAAYWWLGKVLKVIEAEFERAGDEQGWADWREKHHVNRTREYRCRLYIAAFGSAKGLERLAIKKADRLAREKAGKQEPQSEEQQRLRRRLLQLKKRLLPEILRDFAAVEDCGQLSALLAEIDELWHLVQEAARQRMGDEGPAKSQDQRPKPR